MTKTLRMPRSLSGRARSPAEVAVLRSWVAAERERLWDEVAVRAADEDWPAEPEAA